MVEGLRMRPRVDALPAVAVAVIGGDSRHRLKAMGCAAWRCCADAHIHAMPKNDSVLAIAPG
jgi:hypothetical protein